MKQFLGQEPLKWFPGHDSARLHLAYVEWEDIQLCDAA
jgi:hypothetical protein